MDKVHSADELFVSGTFAGVFAVIEIDGIIVGDGARGVFTKKLQEYYRIDIEKRSLAK